MLTAHVVDPLGDPGDIIGVRILQDGTVLFKRAPGAGDHQPIFRPVTYQEIEELELVKRLETNLRKIKGVLKRLKVPRGPKGHVVHVEVWPASGFPICHEKDSACPYTRKCANHTTAGDYRTEGGLTPDLHKHEDKWFCSKNPDGVGPRLGDGTVDEPRY